MINHDIGAAGVVSQECKAVVDQYGQAIIDLLMVEAELKKICSQVGLCTFDGTRGVSTGIESVVDEKEGRSSGLNDVMCSACEMAWFGCKISYVSGCQVAWEENQRLIVEKFLLCQILHSLLVGNLLISPHER
ncbi:hypothetical protein ACS0TY_033670 [Phlomoides rotata]